MPDQTRTKPATRAVALALILGGAAGIFTAVWAQWKVFTQTGMRPSTAAILTFAFIMVFAWTTWVGVELWLGKPRAAKWAKLVLIMQMPKISLPGFAYHFYTTLAAFFSLSRGTGIKTEFDLELGSAIRFLISPDPGDTLIGLNLFAVALFVVLLETSTLKTCKENSIISSVG